MTEPDYHRAHEAYIGAVADALHDAGFPIPDYHADANDPRDAAIQIGNDADDDDPVEDWICWTEESGWYHGIDAKGHGELSCLRWAHLGPLPTPAQVMSWYRKLGFKATEHAEMTRPYYRSFQDQHDGFEDQLVAYATPTTPANAEEQP